MNPGNLTSHRSQKERSNRENCQNAAGDHSFLKIFCFPMLGLRPIWTIGDESVVDSCPSEGLRVRPLFFVCSFFCFF